MYLIIFYFFDKINFFIDKIFSEYKKIEDEKNEHYSI